MTNLIRKAGLLVPVVLLLAGCALMTGGGYTPPAQSAASPAAASAAASVPPGVCRGLQVMDLETAKEIIDNAMSPNGKVNDGDTPMTPAVMAALGKDAQKLGAYAAQVSGPLKAALQAEALRFAEAGNSPNGTVANDTATATDTAYKTIAAECPS